MAQKRGLSSEQAQASDPAANVWVQANAGTGKTSVLVQRLLRILFRSAISSQQSAILCLTYTNAGAGEMRNRILAALREWAMADDGALRELLRGIAHGPSPTNEDLARARAIFYEYIDNPQILKIRTIHGFCEEILRRFPCEAGISPAWGLVSDADQRRMLHDAFQGLISFNGSAGFPQTEYGGAGLAQTGKQGDLGSRSPHHKLQIAEAFAHIVGRVSEHSLDDLLGILSEQYKQFFQVGNIVKHRQQFLDTTEKYLNPNSLGQTDFAPEKLQKIIEIAESEIKASKKPAGYLTNIVNLTKQLVDTTIEFKGYQKAYLTATGGKIANVSKKDYLQEEQDRVHRLAQREANQQIFKDTVALFDLSAAFAQCYKELKASRNLLDFDDLILYTHRLFANPESMGWVLSQLDLSLGHILVDEAQDTSPLQWEILKALSTDFFTDGGAVENPRSLFVVGDTKQSIYRFQGADPNAFAASRAEIADNIKNNLRVIQEIPLAQSFRSTAAVLKTVDYFFNQLPGFANNDHKVFRTDAPGLVELHKLTQSEEKSAIARREHIKTIADKIANLVADGMAPSDIMVLVQRRAPFAAPLVNELKKRDIPVAGSDRIILPEFPAIRDLLNLTRFCIDPTDDYALACMLKSPMFRLSENDLFKICHNRDNKDLLSRVNELCPTIYNQLQQILGWSAVLAPYSFFMRVLNADGNRQKIIAALGTQVIEPLEEFLTICLSYERTQSGMLKQWLKWFCEGGSEIKRELSSADGVRITTVHGSKGLEASAVFLIDTIRTPRDKPERVVPITKNLVAQKPDDGRLALRSLGEGGWLWAPKATASDKWADAAESAMQEQLAEYWRLLYVAMTRARDQLFIYGFCTNKNPPPDAWHTQLWETLQSMPGAAHGEDVIRISNE